MVLHLFLDEHGIALDVRMREGKLLSLVEIEALTRMCRLPINQADQQRETDSHGTSPKVVSLEAVRMRSQRQALPEISPDVAGTRMRSIRDYLAWLAKVQLSQHGLEPVTERGLSVELQSWVDAINARIPRKAGGNLLDAPEGLPEEAVAELLRLINPDSDDNPWSHPHARYRNELLILWLLFLGPRRGEALGIRVRDINFQKGTVTIHRSADDPEDPRANPPEAKTRARELAVGEQLLKKTQAYVLTQRRTFLGARKHEFLFVAGGTGKPMSIAAADKVFRVLRANCTSLPASVRAHVLRHTWNDRFSKTVDEKQIPPETESKLRIYQMGWSQTSYMAAIYGRRHTRNKAAEVSLALQNQLVGKSETK